MKLAINVDIGSIILGRAVNRDITESHEDSASAMVYGDVSAHLLPERCVSIAVLWDAGPWKSPHATTTCRYKTSTLSRSECNLSQLKTVIKDPYYNRNV